MSRAQRRIVAKFAEKLARDLGWTREQVDTYIGEAVDAGLLRVTRTGLQAVIPERDR